MKQVRINRLKLTNFKGVKNFEIQMDGEGARVYGDNATGKTTLFDAFLWLLFDKDSQNKKDFSIKTLQDGKPISMVDHEVECELSVDEKPVTLKKVYREKWTKTRGSSSKEFSGHETDYFFDGTPLKKGEYAKRIEDIVQEEIFKLLTSPSYFNEQVKWQDRRKILLEVCGEISDEDVFVSDNELKGLQMILKGKTLEDFRKTVNARRKQINDELERIPVRIDETNRSIPEDEGNRTELKEEVEKLNSEIDSLQNQINSIKSGNAILIKEGELQKVENEIQSFRHSFESESKENLYRLQTKLQEEQGNHQLLLSRKSEKERLIAHNNRSIERLEQKLADLRKEWSEVNTRQPAHNIECACPACGQELPENQVKAAEEKALTQFNLEKSNQLKRIKEAGSTGAQDKKEFEAENEQHSEETDKLSASIDDKHAAVQKLSAEIEAAKSNMQEASDAPEYQKLLQKQYDLKVAVESLRNSAEESISSINEEIAELKAKRSQLNAEIAAFANVKNLKERIAELMEQEELLAAEFEKLEHHLFLSDEFIRTKVKLMEERINAKFKFARFKLFETQINGGLQEVCETLYEGVPYGSGLNNAARINVGLDIINTLSEFHGIQAPIFVDNAEAVTELIETDAQLISLIVSASDKKLRIEKSKLEEAI